MNKNDAFQILDALNAMVERVPDELLLSVIGDKLSQIVSSPEISTTEIYELITHYRNRDAPALKKFFARMFDDTKREIEDIANCAQG